MGGEFQRVEANATHPFRDEARVLAGRQGAIGALAAREQVVPRLAVGEAKVVVESLTRRLGQLKANGPARLPLPDGCPVDGIAVGRDATSYVATWAE
jgi:hypothetical protein